MSEKRISGDSDKGRQWLQTPVGSVAYHPGFLDRTQQLGVLKAVREVVRQAPLFTPAMPRSGRLMSVRMTNCGQLGWVTDKAIGYRYQNTHPVTGKPWPPIPSIILDIWHGMVPHGPEPEACLINFYNADAKMGMHQDRDESTFDAPVVSISLGDSCRFRIGGIARGGRTVSQTLESGDAIVLEGENRLAFHGVDRIIPGTSKLLKDGGRLNLTLRRVTPFT